MSATLVWIFLPAISGMIIAVWGERQRWLPFTGILLVGALALLGWFLPVNEPVGVGIITIRILPDFVILGRSFVIGVELLRIVGSLYAAVFLWSLGSLAVQSGRFFIPAGLIAGSLLVVAISVRPWQFAGIFILLAVLILLPLLSPPGSIPSRGVMNFISFQTIGVPFLLIAGTLMEGLEFVPAGLSATLRPSILIGFGFAFLLALFPFHAWIPALFEADNPYAVAFVLVLLPGTVGVIGLQIIDRYLWLRASETFFTLIRTIGMLSVLTGGAWALSQRHAGRIFGYLALADIGVMLISIGSGASGPKVYFPLLVARSVGFFLFAAGLQSAKAIRNSLELEKLKGLFQDKPVVALSIWMGVFSIAGFPMLTGFVPKWFLITTLADFAPSAAIVVTFGMAAMAAAGLRMIAAMVKQGPAPEESENPADGREMEQSDFQDEWLTGLRTFTLVSGCLLILAGGIFPDWMARIVESLPLAFAHLSR